MDDAIWAGVISSVGTLAIREGVSFVLRFTKQRAESQAAEADAWSGRTAAERAEIKREWMEVIKRLKREYDDVVADVRHLEEENHALVVWKARAEEWMAGVQDSLRQAGITYRPWNPDRSDHHPPLRPDQSPPSPDRTPGGRKP